MSEEDTTVILGAGVIGLSTAYYLSLSSLNTHIHLIDPRPLESLHTAASAFAGGLLAKTWFPPALAPLGALSFDLHKQLAAQHSGREKWGYAGVRGVSFVEGEGEGKERPEDWLKPEDWLAGGGSRADAASVEVRVGKGPAWLRRAEGKGVRVLSGRDGGSKTALVDPLKLCEFLLAECLSRGVQLHTSTTAVSITSRISNLNSTGHVIHLRQPNGTLFVPFSNVVLAAGAWTSPVYRTLFPTSDLELPITAISGHSVLLRSSEWEAHPASQGVETDAVFATDESGDYFPEMFYRADGSIWLGGINHPSSEIPLPQPSAKPTPLASSISKLRETAEYLYGLPSSNIVTERESICFRPVTPAGLPIVAKVPDVRLGRGWGRRNAVEGVYVAAGHGPWGISGSLGTGKVVSQMVLGEDVSVDLSGLGLQKGGEGWQARARL
ncbi:FAD dependent oxidoreductase [Lophium mytilinum]|uniref:FAD dependent oxidoreductase n=1 Tax=Lophium mytilinum TaxID=390894 RepID=A0A6A6QWA6_9PEZI|nr:FAD dependent oxidoreductase [Lophium mytilinum]